MAVAHLVYGGVLDRHPDLDVCLSHGGGAAAFMAGRLQHQGRTRPWARDDPRDFAGGLRRLWFDQHVHDDRALALLTSAVGADRLVVGTNLAGWDAPSEAGDISYLPPTTTTPAASSGSAPAEGPLAGPSIWRALAPGDGGPRTPSHPMRSVSNTCS